MPKKGILKTSVACLSILIIFSLLQSVEARVLTEAELNKIMSNATAKPKNNAPEYERVQKFVNLTLTNLQTKNVSEALGTLEKAEVFVLLNLVVPQNLNLALANLEKGQFSNSLAILNDTRSLLSSYVLDIKNMSQGNYMNITMSEALGLQSLLNLPSTSQLNVNNLLATQNEGSAQIDSRSGDENLDQEAASSRASVNIQSESDQEAASSTTSTSQRDTNQRPISLDASFTLTKNTPTEITLTSRDPEDDRIVEIIIQDNPEHGIVSNIEVTDNPSVFRALYTPDFDFVGEDSFTFISSDGVGTSDIAATIRLNIEDVTNP